MNVFRSYPKLAISLAGAVALTALAAPIVNKSYHERRSPSDNAKIKQLLHEMTTADLKNMTVIAVQPYKLPEASLDVMRVRLEETYDVKGVGKDTVQLYGWIAVAHDTPVPAKGETEVKWGTAISDTEFVGLDLKGESKIFGPVHVTFDPNQPSLGRVGKLSLSLIERITSDVAYAAYRPASAQAMAAKPARTAAINPTSTGSESPESKEISKLLESLLANISAKDANAVLKYYASESPSGMNRSVALREMFAGVKTIRATSNDDLNVKTSGRYATATLTGTNDVVDINGRRSYSNWQWSVQLENTASGWKIADDTLSLVADPNTPADAKVAAVAAACAANVAVNINMPKLNLAMTVSHPVMWYSEVTTIPPVGETASVSFIPTPLISNGREVATLTHGAVKFREIVKKVDLDGSNWLAKIARR